MHWYMPTHSFACIFIALPCIFIICIMLTNRRFFLFIFEANFSIGMWTNKYIHWNKMSIFFLLRILKIDFLVIDLCSADVFSLQGKKKYREIFKWKHKIYVFFVIKIILLMLSFMLVFAVLEINTVFPFSLYVHIDDKISRVAFAFDVFSNWHHNGNNVSHMM